MEVQQAGGIGLVCVIYVIFNFCCQIIVNYCQTEPSANIKFCMLLENSHLKTLEMLKKANRNDMIKEMAIYECHKHFNASRRTIKAR